MNAVFGKSPKGSREASGRTHDLPEDLRALLKSCRGRFTIEAKSAQAPADERERIAAALADLVAAGYLREIPHDWRGDEDAADDTDAAANDNAGEEAGEAADEGVDDVAGRLRADVAGRRGQRDESTSELIKEMDEAARLKAEQRAAREAEESARREAAEQARREAGEKARHEAEEQARRDADERARREAEEQARLQAEEAQRRKEEELLRAIAEKKARKAAREKARLEEEERDREAIKERIRLRNETRRRVILPTILGLLLPVALVLLVLQFFSFDGRRIAFERAAAELFDTPVKIGSARLSILTGPQWLMNDVAIGADADAVKIARVRIGTSWLGLFGTPVAFDAVHLEGPQLPPPIALKLLTDASGNALLKSGELTATGLVFAGAQSMPPLDLRASYREGRLTRISGRGEDAESGKLSFDMSRAEQWRLTLDTTQVRWLLGPGLSLTNVALNADLTEGSILIRQFSGTLFDGELSGSGNIGWQDGWRAAARIEAKRLDPTRFAPAWIQEGRVSGSAAIAAAAANPGELLSRARTGGSFDIGRGLLVGLDLDQVAQNRGLGEQFRFESLKGDFLSDSGSMEFSDLRLVAGELTANGTLGIGANGAANGRIAIEVRTPGVRRTASVRVGGSLAAPQYQR